MRNFVSQSVNELAKKIANFKPIPNKSKQALVKTMQQGKPLPTVIQSALKNRQIAKKFTPTASVVRQTPTASVVRQTPTASVVRQTPTASVVRQTPTASVVRQTPTASVVKKSSPVNFFNNISDNIKKLTQTTNPSIVKAATPIQRSYMPIDLPYETMSKKKYAMKIPNTNFAFSTDVDLVQPPVDGGIINYYGK
jgi:hypothetical protein